ncbi:MAG: nucleotidyltransferase domain-containing protein [bacterium]
MDYDSMITALKKNALQIKKEFPFVIQIFLFGSFSKGNFSPESDVDILIIVKKISIPFLERRDQFYKFFKEIPFDVNILIYSETEIEKMKKNRNLFITDIMEDAVDLLD